MSLVALALVILTSVASAQDHDAPFVLRAARAAQPPTIDGVIEDGEWDGAALAENFIQYQPHVGEPSVVESQALVMYDSTTLYVAFRLFDSEPPTAQLTRRDAELLDDDAVVILLDSYNDNRTGFFFMTNALGTQADGQIRDDGRTVDATWDASWNSAARLTESGWETEFAIPFISLSYTAGENVTWGINFGRSRRRTLEWSYWAGPLENEFRMSQAGSIVGLQVAPPGRRYRFIPYGLSRIEQGEGELDYRADWQAGLDARYAVTPEMAAFLTVNPDFAIIEADQERVNLTRFELALDEKRPFFLESAQQFGQRIRTFYTRRISDVGVGGQVLGKQGAWNLTGIATWSEVDTLSSEPGVPEVEPPEGVYAIGRAQRDVLGSSNVALTVANRTLQGEDQGSIGADATLFFTRTLGMTAQLAQSWGPFGNGTWAYFIRPSYDSSNSHFHVRYTHLGDRFADNVNVVGFVRDDDRRELDSALGHTFWIRGGAFERVKYRSNYNIYWSQRGTLRSWQIDQDLEVELRSRWSLELEYQEEF
ncbi:MAG: DUF5916 domain-containing protein, partial [Gemmatimonadales bacterium]